MASKKPRTKKQVDSESDSDSDSNDDSNDDSSSSSDSNSNSSGSDSDSSEDEVVAPKKKKPAAARKKAAATKKSTPAKRKKTMSSSSSSNDSDDAEFDDGFDEDFYGDEQDRKELDAMNELKREEVIDKRRQKRETQQMIRDAKANLKKKNKQDEMDATTPRTVKRRTEQDKDRNKKSLALKALQERKKQMEKKKRDLEQSKDSDSESEKKPKKKKSKFQDSDSGSDTESDSDSSADEVEERDRGRKSQDWAPSSPTPARSKFPVQKLENANFGQMRDLHVSRKLAARWMDEPYFEECMKNLFVRLCVGTNSKTNKPAYLLCEVVGFTTKNSYKIEGQSTNKGLELAHGGSVRSWRMDVLSNSRFLEQEVESWHKQLKTDGMQQFTTQDAKQRLADKRHRDKKYIYSEQDVQNAIDTKKKRKGDSFIPSIANERSKMSLELEKLESEGTEIEQIEEIKKKLRILDKKEDDRKASRVQGEFIGSLLNKKNRIKNATRDSYVAPKDETKKKGDLNPFQRRDCRPSISWDVTKTKAEEAPKEEEKKVEVSKPVLKKDESTESGTGNEIIANALDDIRNIEDTMGVDEFEEFIGQDGGQAGGEKDDAGDLLPKEVAKTAPGGWGKKVAASSSSKEGRKRKGLSLKDYMKKAEAIQGIAE